MKKYLFLLLLVLQTAAATASVPGSQPVFLNGTVSDAATGETLAGVEVRVKGSSQVIYTDLDGRFSLADLPEGEIVLEFHYQLYELKTVSVNVNAAGAGAFNQEQLAVQLQSR
ncbi:MAG: carboxypeptidase-like regulatory domain-containing protein [Bacteroidia bacterium]|jgi:hypothetical protein|nr:carboxypeptidase-like regulatory domain-containing protein [Bacteroidia bacterium]